MISINHHFGVKFSPIPNMLNYSSSYTHQIYPFYYFGNTSRNYPRCHEQLFHLAEVLDSSLTHHQHKHLDAYIAVFALYGFFRDLKFLLIVQR